MKLMLDKDELVRRIAEKGHFNLSDTRIFLDSFIEVIKELLIHDSGFNVRGLGKLYIQELPPRKSSNLFGRINLPKAKRVIFKLSEDIRDLVK